MDKQTPESDAATPGDKRATKVRARRHRNYARHNPTVAYASERMSRRIRDTSRNRPTPGRPRDPLRKSDDARQIPLRKMARGARGIPPGRDLRFLFASRGRLVFIPIRPRSALTWPPPRRGAPSYQTEFALGDSTRAEYLEDRVAAIPNARITLSSRPRADAYRTRASR